MNGNRKLTDKELLLSLHRQADRDEAVAMSDAQVKADLEAAGFDLAEVERERQALLRSPGQFLVALHRQADRDDAGAVSDAQVKADLEAAGFDLAEIERERQALFADKAPAKGGAVEAPKPAPVIPLAPRRRRITPYLLAAAATLVALGAAAYVERAHLARIFFHAEQVPPPNPTHLDIARNILTQAAAACDDKRWQECSKLVDDAFDEDSKIASDPEFHMVRDASRLGLGVDGDTPWLKKLRLGLPVPPVPGGNGKEKGR